MNPSHEYRAVFEDCDLDFNEFRASFQPRSRLHPSRNIAHEAARNVDMLNAQFQKWFLSALHRVGLTEVIERRLGRLLTDEERGDWTKVDTSKLPWMAAISDTPEQVGDAPVRRRGSRLRTKAVRCCASRIAAERANRSAAYSGEIVSFRNTARISRACSSDTSDNIPAKRLTNWARMTGSIFNCFERNTISAARSAAARWPAAT